MRHSVTPSTVFNRRHSSTVSIILTLTVSLLVHWWTPMAEASPLARTRRAAFSTFINLSKLKNPCNMPDTPAATTVTCSDNDGRLAVRIANAKEKLNTLKTQSMTTGESNGQPARDFETNTDTSEGSTCDGPTLDPAIPPINLTPTMTKEDKMREIYKSIVHHVAYLQVIEAQPLSNTQLKTAITNAIASLVTVQCNVQCTLGMTWGQFEEVAREVGGLDYPSGQNDSSNSMKTCIISSSATAMLDQLSENA